jgi:hypothetical protein
VINHVFIECLQHSLAAVFRNPDCQLRRPALARAAIRPRRAVDRGGDQAGLVGHSRFARTSSRWAGIPAATLGSLFVCFPGQFRHWHFRHFRQGRADVLKGQPEGPKVGRRAGSVVQVADRAVVLTWVDRLAGMRPCPLVQGAAGLDELVGATEVATFPA